jgi:YVTN family beta-propeller protein
MKKLRLLLMISLFIVFTLLSSGSAFAGNGHYPANGKVVVANRAEGTISIIDARTNEVVDTVALPDGENPPEPMYVVYSAVKDRVFVGDRGNDRVVVFDARDFSVEGTVPAGAGVFHMWADARGRQLWVNNDIDNTTTVINPRTLEVITTVPTPADLVAQGGKPHDVILGPFGRLAYVTVLGLPGDHDYLVQYNTRTFEEINRAPVGKDPHLSLARQHNRLYVPSQDSNMVIVFNRFTLEEIARIDVPGAHGAGMSPNGRVFYTTNLSGGGTDGLFAIDTQANTLIGEPVDTPYPVPHNIALTRNGRKLFVTHSGATADKVTIYTVSEQNPEPVLAGEVTVGLNPFGLAFVP